MRLQATLLLIGVLSITPVAYAVDPERGGGATLPPSGGAVAPDPATPEPTEPTAPPLVPLDDAPEPAGGAKLEEPAAPAGEAKARAAQTDDGYTEVQVPAPGAEEGAGEAEAAAAEGDGLAETGLELSLIVAAGMSMLGTGLLVTGLVRKPR